MGRGTYNAYVVALDISQLTGFGGPRTQQLTYSPVLHVACRSCATMTKSCGARGKD
jgi:hypothetical protein